MNYVIKFKTSMDYVYYYTRPDKYTNNFDFYRTISLSDATKFSTLKQVRDELLSFQKFFLTVKEIVVYKVETKEIETKIPTIELLAGE